MKWLDSWIQRAYNRARSRDEIVPIARSNKLSGKTRVSSNHDDANVYNFTIYGANGGQIVEVVTYDEKNDREQVRRYVISDDEDLSNSLSKIVTMEFLR